MSGNSPSETACEDDRAKSLAQACREIAAVCGVEPLVREDPAPAQIRCDLLRELLAYWSRLADGAPPHHRRFDVLDVGFAVGNLMLLEVIDGGRDFRYRVAGSLIVERYGKELTGRLVSEGFIPLSARFYLATHRLVVASHRPLLTDHVPPQPVPVTRWTRLVLPFVDDEGHVVRILSGVVPGQYRSIDDS